MKPKFNVGDLVRSAIYPNHTTKRSNYIAIWKVRSIVLLHVNNKLYYEYSLKRYGDYPLNETKDKFIIHNGISYIGWVREAELKKLPKKMINFIALCIVAGEDTNV